MFWLDEIFGGPGLEWPQTEPDAEWRPDLDVFERADGILLCFGVPGLGEDDIELLLAGDALIVRGNRDLQALAGAKPRSLELPRGRFERRVRLPSSVTTEGMQTQLTRGLLLVHLPRRDDSVRIRVQHR